MKPNNLIKKIMPWITWLDEEKELILLSALGGNPKTDKITKGRIKVLFVTEPCMMVESLINGTKSWAKDVKYEYFKNLKADPYIPFQEQLPYPYINKFDVIYLTINTYFDIDKQAKEAFGYFNNLEDKNYPIKKQITKLKQIRPEIKSNEKNLLIEKYIKLKEMDARMKLCIPINPKVVITLKNLSEAEAKLKGRKTVFINDIERAVHLFTGLFRKEGIEEQKTEVDYLNEKAVEKKREKVNQLYRLMKNQADKNGIISLLKIKKLNREVKIQDEELME